MGATKKMQLEQAEAEFVCKNCIHWGTDYAEDGEDIIPRYEAESGVCGECGKRTNATDNCNGVGVSNEFEFC
jgi:Zn finger protein HypA/HybF involved in hydrogenase expression